MFRRMIDHGHVLVEMAEKSLGKLQGWGIISSTLMAMAWFLYHRVHCWYLMLKLHWKYDQGDLATSPGGEYRWNVDHKAEAHPSDLCYQPRLEGWWHGGHCWTSESMLLKWSLSSSCRNDCKQKTASYSVISFMSFQKGRSETMAPAFIVPWGRPIPGVSENDRSTYIE